MRRQTPNGRVPVFYRRLGQPGHRCVAAAHGLQYALDRGSLNGIIHGRTPSGGDGTILGDQQRLGDADLAYRGDDLQVWRRRTSGDSVWVGYWKHSPPTPEELARERQLPGELVTLGDGRRWRVPRLLAYQGGSGFTIDLPCYADLDGAGKWVNGEVLDEYADAAGFAERLYEGVILAELGKGRRLTSEEALTMSVRLLQFNYAVSEREAGMLRLLPIDERLKDVVKAAVDWDTFVAWYEKKNADSARAGSAGLPA